MLSRLFHPETRTLSDFVDGELSSGRARRVAQHVAACQRCRSFVWSCRRLDAVAHELPTPALPDALRQRVLDRRAAGDDVILPVVGAESGAGGSAATTAATTTATSTADDSGPARRGRRLVAVAATLAVAVGIGVFVVGTPTLTAESSELVMTPAAPQPGDTIRVEYRATSRLNAHGELVLRARHARPNTVMDATDHTVLATLVKRSDGVYTGAFVLPADVSYAVLAVEDADARDVDHNGERWEVLLHHGDGTPLLDALHAQYRDTRMRNRIVAAEVAARATQLYPNSVRAWTHYYSATSDLLDGDQVDSLRAARRAALPALLDAQGDAVAPRSLSEVIFYAGMIRDTTTARLYRERLISEFPLDPVTQQQRVFVISSTWAGDTAAFWQRLDELWQETDGMPRHGQIEFTGWQTAQQWRDDAALARWGRRMADDAGNAGWIGQTFAANPALRDEGIAMIRAYIERMEGESGMQRGLTHTADEFGAMRNRYRGQLLADLGTALAAAGRQGESDVALAAAVDLAWHPPLFRSVADTRLRAGDTIAALPLLARVAVDPATSSAFADSVSARVGSHLDVAAWDQHRRDAMQVMQRHTMFRATNRPVRGTARVRNSDGAQTTYDAAAGTITFVAFWSRYCPPSQMQLGQLAQLARTLQQQGVRVVTITEERPSPQLAAFIAQNNLDFEVLHDVDREARRAFDNFGTPAYLVVDRDGRVRFQSHGLEDVRRQVHLLQHGTRLANP